MRLLLACILILTAAVATADEFDVVKTRIEAAMTAEIRGERDTARDDNRMPVETLKFFGLRANMHVLELIPGGGWYTKLLAPVLAEDGKLTVAIGTGRLEKSLLSKPGFDKVSVTAKDANATRPEGSYYYRLELGSLGVSDADMVLTFRNYHNFDLDGRMAMNRAAFAALKPGGVYGVVDHTRRHMQKNDPENRRRVDPVLAIKEIQAAGFVLEDFSNLHYRADDELQFEVGRKTVTGNTDRWSLRFRKPR